MTDRMKTLAHTLDGKKVLLTGGGGGIGFEAAKTLAFMGATVILAELDREKGRRAEAFLRENFPETEAQYYAVDLADEAQVRAMHRALTKRYGFIDVLVHNACVTPIGKVEDVPADTWEKSYQVNFKAPLLLTQMFLPQMRQENRGVIVFVPSSGAAPYMGAYEVFKTAQAELCSTLAGELEGTGVFTYAIGPGLVRTETAERSIELVAGKMGMSTDEFYAMNGSHILSAEEAGRGFALSVLYAERYNGQEIGAVQALIDGGQADGEIAAPGSVPAAGDAPLAEMEKMIAVYRQQYAGWMSRNVFERQWVLRDFKKTVGMSADRPIRRRYGSAASGAGPGRRREPGRLPGPF